MDAKLMSHIKDIIKFMDEHVVDIKPLPKLVIKNDPKYIDDILAPTGYYDPNTQTVAVYIAGRHWIDICKTIIHELTHHSQYLQGRLTPDLQNTLQDPNYMENNPEMMELEKEAYLLSGLVFRLWRDEKRSSV